MQVNFQEVQNMDDSSVYGEICLQVPHKATIQKSTVLTSNLLYSKTELRNRTYAANIQI